MNRREKLGYITDALLDLSNEVLTTICGIIREIPVVHWLPRWQHFKTASSDERKRAACGLHHQVEGTSDKHKVTCKRCLRIMAETKTVTWQVQRKRTLATMRRRGWYREAIAGNMYWKNPRQPGFAYQEKDAIRLFTSEQK